MTSGGSFPFLPFWRWFAFRCLRRNPSGSAPLGLSGNRSDEARTALAAKGAVAQRFRTAKNYVLFYGTPNETTMENLSTYDIVVLEPQALGPNAKARIAALRATGTIVIGYMSFFSRSRSGIDTGLASIRSGRSALMAKRGNLGARIMR